MAKQPPNEFSIIAKRNQKMNQKRLVLDRKYSKMLGLRKEKLEARKQKEIDRYERKWKKSMDIELHNITHKRQKKEPIDKTVEGPKKEALKQIQKYSKLSRAVWSTEGPKVFLVDTLERVPLKKVNGGHCYSQRNYPQLAFNINNIRPITSMGNRKQLDTIGEWKKNLPKDVIEELDREAENKTIKRSMRDRKFYEEIIEKYKKFNEIEEKRLGLYTK